MGLFSFISNAAMYKGFAVGKMSLMAMFTGLPPVVVALLAFAVWGERLSVWQLLAFVVIMSGLLMVRYSNDLSLRNLQGAQWGVLTMLFFGLTDFFHQAGDAAGRCDLPDPGRHVCHRRHSVLLHLAAAAGPSVTCSGYGPAGAERDSGSKRWRERTRSGGCAGECVYGREGRRRAGQPDRWVRRFKRIRPGCGQAVDLAPDAALGHDCRHHERQRHDARHACLQARDDRARVGRDGRQCRAGHAVRALCAEGKIHPARIGRFDDRVNGDCAP